MQYAFSPSTPEDQGCSQNIYLRKFGTNQGRLHRQSLHPGRISSFRVTISRPCSSMLYMSEIQSWRKELFHL